MKKFVTTLSTILAIAVAAFPQQGQSTENKADQMLRSTGRVNPSTLGMEFDLPMGSYPGRGISIPISLSYSSKVWRLDLAGDKASNEPSGCTSYYHAKYAENSASGWTTSLAVPYVEYVGLDNPFTPAGFPHTPETTFCHSSGVNLTYEPRISVHLPGGQTHELRLSNGVYYSADGSNLRYVENSSAGTYRLLMPDGSYYDFATGNTVQMNGATVRMGTKYSDTDGNYVSYNNTTGVWTDTLGRQFTAPFGLTAPTAPTGSTPVTYTLPGMTSPYKFHWKKLKGDSEEESALANYSESLKYAGSKCKTNASPWWSDCASGLFGGWVLAGANPYNPELFNPVVLAEIELPTGQKYEFQYDLYGRVVTILYPTGGKEEFTYGQIAPLSYSDAYNVTDQTNYGVTQRRVFETASLGTPSSTWNYAVTENGAGGYMVTTTNPDSTVSQRFLHRADEACVGCEEGTFGYDNALAGMAYEERQFASDGALVSRKLTHWTKSSSGGYPMHVDWHPRVDHEETYTYDSTGAGVYSTTKYEYEGDPAASIEAPLLVRKTTEWGYQTTSGGGSITASATPSASPTPVPTPTPSNPVRITESTYLINDANYSSTVRDAYKARNMVGLVTTTKTKNGAGTTVVAQSEIKYDEPTLSNPNLTNAYRGQPTTVRNWLDTNNSWIETKTKYDPYGNAIEMTDGRWNTTTATYDTAYHAFPVQVTSPVPSDGTHGSNTAFVTTTSYDSFAGTGQPPVGLPISTTDANGLETRMEYEDPMLRPTRVATYQNNQQVGAAAETIYGEGTSSSNRYVKTRSQVDGTSWKEAYVWYDGLGRTTKTQSVDAADGDVFVETQYDNMGRPFKVTNPYRNGETVYWTESIFDTASRPWKTVTPDSAFVETTYSVATTGGNIGTAVTVTDQAGKQRRSVTNALGHLTRVDEPVATGPNAGQLGAINTPNQPTFYTYDLLNNLTQVQQPGDNNEECGPSTTTCSQTRSFSSDSLSRLKQATNPESGTIQYSYDANSNLQTKTDARGVVTTYAYDALNRVKTRQYANEPTGSETPDVSYYYDLLTNAKGKLIKVTSSVSTTEYTGFDILGRVTSHKQTTDGSEYATSYKYSLAGALIEETYPSGRVVRNTLDSNGDLAAVLGRKATHPQFWAYANNFKYSSAGAVTQTQLGNGLWESTVFNARLQPTQIALGTTQNATNVLDLDYTYGTTANNGNVLSQTITVPTVGTTPGFTAVQSYSYDQLNRLQQADEKPQGWTDTNCTSDPTKCWKQKFVYDRYGNRRFDEANTTMPSSFANQAVTNPTISPNNNRLTSTGYSFDAAGNTTRDAEDRKFIYDAENKQTKAESLTPGTNTVTGTIGEYSFDGDGKRVKKYVPSTGETTMFIYNAAGKFVAEYSTVVASQQDAKIAYLTNDHLGSPRINTDANGAVTSRHDYHPFGESIATSHRVSGIGYASDAVRKQFTGYERDNESELDFAQARYYNPRHGRFHSVDPESAGADEEDPQSWNAFAYARANPLLYTDPDGREYLICSVGEGKRQCYRHNDSDVHKSMKAGDYFYDGTKSDKTGLRSGSMYDADGSLVATYQQISHDDPIQAMLWGAKPTLDIWQPVIEAVQPTPIPGGGVLGTTAKVGTKGAKGFVIGRKVVKSTGFVGKALEKLGLVATKGAGRGVLEVAGTADEALMVFNELRGANKVRMVAPGVWTAESASGAGTVTFRSVSKSGPPTVDVHGLEQGIRKIKFK